MNRKNTFKQSFGGIFFLVLLISIVFLTTRQLGMRKAEQVVQPKAVQQEPFTIQVASFRDRARSEIVVKELKKEGFLPVISVADLEEKGIWHRVCVGDFINEDEASVLLETLKKDYKDSFIKLR